MARRKLYRFKKCRQILKYAHKQLKRRRNRLGNALRAEIESVALDVDQGLLERNREEASRAAHHLETLCKTHLKKTSFESLRDSAFGLAVALAVAVVVRQSWFELYEIPTGSMRPTLREKDRLIVSKSQFGINIPLTTKHLLYDDKRVERGNIVVFTSHNMDIPDANMLYFYLFPGKKQLIKRMIGKPGDTLYFQGGKIYGIDKEGNDISHELQRYSDIDHIPYIQLDGKVASGKKGSATFSQMNQPIAQIDKNASGRLRGKLINPPSAAVKTYSDFWGIGNYGMTQLLTKDEVRADPNLTLYDVPEGELYLVIRHHPDIRTSHIGQDRYGKVRPILGLSHSIVPLKEEHLQKLFGALYTARFTAKNGHLFRWDYGRKHHTPYAFTPKCEGLPDGNYEYYSGIPYRVNWEGILTKVSDTHPLKQYSPELLRLFYNGGIELDEHFMPSTKRPSLEPQRFAYFREGALYTLGVPLLEKGDPLLDDFIARETAKAESAPTYKPYAAFTDPDAPTRETIENYGIRVPEKSYLVLGDNYAMSADSRDFGFVPESNIRGVPNFIFWPPGNRLGAPRQKGYDIFTTSRVVVWIVAGATMYGWSAYQRRRRKERLAAGKKRPTPETT